IDSDRPDFRIRGGLWDGHTLYQLYQKAHTPWSWHERLFDHARRLGLVAFSSPFDATAVDFLESLAVPAYKIASFELVDLPLIRRVAATGKPMILSTGMANLEEIEDAIGAAGDAGATSIALLHCVSGYPTPHSEANLHTLTDLGRRFPWSVVGLSDHSRGTTVASTAVALGAAIVEKHLTLSRTGEESVDAAFSLEPEELAHLCRDCRITWEAVGRVNYDRTPSEIDNLVFRRSLYVVADMAVGEPFTETNLRSIRPGFGLPPRHLPMILGRHASVPIDRGTPLSWSLVEPI
ncbi:MAG: pseudaminic acid synthase, partial [Magnetococcales bacterium]|nr:pseudaminic acid synthase [Magnetococcales bacterium]